eukprot:5077668-Prymnesium_polylepis.1
MGICIAVRSARASQGLVVKLVRGWPQKRESRVRTPRARVGGDKWGGTARHGAVRCGGWVRCVRCGAVRSVGAGRARRGLGAGAGLFGAVACGRDRCEHRRRLLRRLPD